MPVRVRLEAPINIERIAVIMPYHIVQDMKSIMKRDVYPSFGGLQRTHDLLQTFEIMGAYYHFWLSHTKTVAEITTETKDDIGQIRQLVVSKVRFDNRSNLPVENELQVDTVYTHIDYQTMNLAVTLYRILARYNYTIVSDFTQYNGGKALWKKLAKESEARKFVVRVWDDETQDWMKDSSSNAMKYNAENMDDEEIWKDISQHNEATTLLVLSSSE